MCQKQKFDGISYNIITNTINNATNINCIITLLLLLFFIRETEKISCEK